MIIFLNAIFECSVTERNDTTQQIETDAFNGKCTEYIEGMRFVPDGDSWTRSDGVIFTGEMISPFVDSRILELAQTEYEKTKTENQIAEQQTAIQNLMLIVGGETIG